LKIGIVGPTFPPVESILSVSRRVEEKGYDSIWFPDHLMGWVPDAVWTPELVGPMAQYSPHTFFETALSIAIAASSTRSIRVGSAVTEAVRHHPAMLAQSYATLEHVSNGRVVLGLGAGEAENIEPYGLEYERVVSRLEEAIRVIKLLWSLRRGEKANYSGDFFSLKDAVFDLPPLRTRPPIWIGGVNERMCRLVARYSDGWLPYVGADASEYRGRMRLIEEECGRVGRPFDQIEKGVYLSVIVDKSSDECAKILDSPVVKATALMIPGGVYERLGYTHPLGPSFNPFTNYIPNRYTREQILAAIGRVPRDVIRAGFLTGSTGEVMECLDGYRKAGAQTAVLWNLTFLGDVSKVKSSYSCIDELVDYFKE